MTYYTSNDPFFGTIDRATNWVKSCFIKNTDEETGSINITKSDLENGPVVTQKVKELAKNEIDVGGNKIRLRKDADPAVKEWAIDLFNNVEVIKGKDKKNNKPTDSWKTKAVKYGTAFVFTATSAAVYRILGFTPIFAATVPLMNRGLKALTDLDKVDASCDTVKGIAKKYIPIAGIIGAAIAVDIFLEKQTPLLAPKSWTQFVCSTALIMAVEDYSTWMRGAHSTKE